MEVGRWRSSERAMFPGSWAAKRKGLEEAEGRTRYSEGTQVQPLLVPAQRCHDDNAPTTRLSPVHHLGSSRSGPRSSPPSPPRPPGSGSAVERSLPNPAVTMKR